MPTQVIDRAKLNPPSRPAKHSWWLEAQASSQTAIWYQRAAKEFWRMRDSREATYVKPLDLDLYL